MSVAALAPRIVPVAVPAADSADPNVSAPAASRVFALSRRVSGGMGARETVGHVLVFAGKTGADGSGNDVADLSVSFTTWWKDARSGEWMALASDTATHRKTKALGTLADADLFVQVTAAAGTGLGSVKVFCLEV